MTDTTPETKWLEQIMDLGVQVNTVQDGDARYREYTFNDAQLQAFISSRDTYWKEQLQKAREESYNKAVHDCINCYSPDDLAHDWKYKMQKLMDHSELEQDKKQPHHKQGKVT